MKHTETPLYYLTVCPKYAGVHKQYGRPRATSGRVRNLKIDEHAEKGLTGTRRSETYRRLCSKHYGSCLVHVLTRTPDDLGNVRPTMMYAVYGVLFRG